MRHLVKLVALTALLSAGCTMSRGARSARTASIPRPTTQKAAREFFAQDAIQQAVTEQKPPGKSRIQTDTSALVEKHNPALRRKPSHIQQVRHEAEPQPIEDDETASALAGDEQPGEIPLPPSVALADDSAPVADTSIDLSVNGTGVYSLEELTALTEQGHPKLKSALSDIESAMGERVQAGLYPNPRMETNNPEIWSGRDSQLNFGWQQNFITKGKMRLDKAAADQKVRVLESQYVIERMEVLTRIRAQYIQTLAARERLRNSEEILAISKSARDVSVELLKTGERTLTDVLLLKNQYERARVTAENNQTELNAELRQLAIATGIPNLVVNDVTGTIGEQPPFYDEEYIRFFLESNSAHMIMARAEVVRRKILLNRAEVEPYPDFRVGPHYAASTTQGSSREFWFTFVFDIPIWNLNQGNIRSARAEVTGAQANVDQRRMELLNDLADIHSRHKTSHLLLSRIESSILPNAVQTQQLVQEGYTQGLLDVNRMLEAQRALLEAKQDQIDAYEQAWRTAAELAGYLQFEQFP